MGDVKKSGAGNDFKQGFVVSTQVVCDFFEISRKTLAQWEHKGAPKEGRGKWDLKKLVDWRYSGQNEESPAARKIKAEADLKEAKAAQEQIKLSMVKQEYLAVEVIQAETTRLLQNLKKSMLAVGHNVAAALASLDPDAAEVARKEVDERIKEALAEMSRGKVYNGRSKSRKKKTTV